MSWCPILVLEDQRIVFYLVILRQYSYLCTNRNLFYVILHVVSLHESKGIFHVTCYISIISERLCYKLAINMILWACMHQSQLPLSWESITTIFEVVLFLSFGEAF